MKESLKSPLTLASTLLILAVALSACSPPGEAASPAGLPAASPPVALAETNPGTPDFVWKCPGESTELDLYFNGLDIKPTKAAFDEELTKLCSSKNPPIKMPIYFKTEESDNPIFGHTDDVFLTKLGTTEYQVNSFTIEQGRMNYFLSNNGAAYFPCESGNTSCVVTITDPELLLNQVVFHEVDHALRYFEGITVKNMEGTEAPAYHDAGDYYNRLLSGKAKKLLSCSETTCMAKK